MELIVALFYETNLLHVRMEINKIMNKNRLKDNHTIKYFQAKYKFITKKKHHFV